MSGIDWSKVYKKHKGLWVALKSDEKTVLVAGKTAKEVWNKAKRSGYSNPILAKMPKSLMNYVGSGHEV